MATVKAPSEEKLAPGMTVMSGMATTSAMVRAEPMGVGESDVLNWTERTADGLNSESMSGTMRDSARHARQGRMRFVSVAGTECIPAGVLEGRRGARAGKVERLEESEKSGTDA